MVSGATYGVQYQIIGHDGTRSNDNVARIYLIFVRRMQCGNSLPEPMRSLKRAIAELQILVEDF